MIFKWIGDLFRVASYEPEPPHVLTPEEEAVAMALRQPAIRLVPEGTGLSRIGGDPNLPAGVEWPSCDGDPMRFLCQIACSELPPLAVELGLPAAGALFFFIVEHQDITGARPGDTPQWRVLYVPELGAGTPERAPPVQPEEDVFRPCPVGFTVVDTWPGTLHRATEAAFGPEDDGVYDAYSDFVEARSGDSYAACHQIGGYAGGLHEDEMDVECEAVAQGLAWDDARRLAIRASSDHWKLLLQLDSDDATGMNWWDWGRLYFWIREGDLKALRFDRCWLMLLSH